MQIQPTLVTALHKDDLWSIALEEVTTAMNSHFVGFLKGLKILLNF